MVSTLDPEPGDYGSNPWGPPSRGIVSCQLEVTAKQAATGLRDTRVVLEACFSEVSHATPSTGCCLMRHVRKRVEAPPQEG